MDKTSTLFKAWYTEGFVDGIESKTLQMPDIVACIVKTYGLSTKKYNNYVFNRYSRFHHQNHSK